MQNPAQTILTINCGSSSVKFARYDVSGSHGGAQTVSAVYTGTVERVGLPGGRLSVTGADGAALVAEACETRSHAEALNAALTWLEARTDGQAPDAVGHRVVHGGARYSQPARIDRETLVALRQLTPLAPLHLPIEISAIEALAARYPATPQVACFDTAFHHTMPPVAQTYGIARRWYDAGVRRYGFHGLSYEYILSQLAEHGAVPERVVVAHLGNGASMAAIRAGKSIETTMGFSPTGGLVMSTRSGDLDPGVLLYLLEAEAMTPQSLRATVERDGGLAGVSEASGDMRDLLERAAHDPRAEAAVELFCYTAKKYLGGLVSVLGGLDTLVFTGGIGERASEVRRRICAGLEFIGLHLDPDRNDASAPVVSARDSAIPVQVIPTCEEAMIARHTAHALDAAP